MARPLRIQAPGAVYHLTARGNRRQVIFEDDCDRLRCLAILADVVRRQGWRCYVYCLMPNHYHLVVETPNPDLSEGMHRLNGVYAQWFNRRHGVDGHLFQGRFHSVAVESNVHLLELARYVVLNPVRADLCRHPREWAWSSYRAMVAANGPPFLSRGWLLAQFGSDPTRARAAYEAFVRDGVQLAA